MTLDYRFPDTGAHRVQKVADSLVVEEELDWVALAGKLVFGVPLCFVGPALLTLCIAPPGLVTIRAFATRFIIISLIVIPLLVWLKRGTKRDFLWDALKFDSAILSGGVSKQYVPHAGGISSFVFILEIFLIGPAMVSSLIDQFRTFDKPDNELRVLAAWIVVELLDVNHSIQIAKLVSGDCRRTTEDVSRALHYLDHLRWIGIARTRDRVWLNDSIRKELADLQ